MAGLDLAQKMFLKREVERRVEGLVDDPVHEKLHKKTFITGCSIMKVRGEKEGEFPPPGVL